MMPFNSDVDLCFSNEPISHTKQKPATKSGEMPKLSNIL